MCWIWRWIINKKWTVQRYKLYRTNGYNSFFKFKFREVRFPQDCNLHRTIFHISTLACYFNRKWSMIIWINSTKSWTRLNSKNSWANSRPTILSGWGPPARNSEFLEISTKCSQKSKDFQTCSTSNDTTCSNCWINHKYHSYMGDIY